MVLILIASCKNIQKEYYKSGALKKEFSTKDGKLHGTYKEYFENGKLKQIHNYSKGKNVDSSLYFYPNTNENVSVIKYWQENKNYYQKEFYPNGKIKKEGMVHDSIILINEWKFYNKEGNLNEIKEYKNIAGKTYLNQTYNLNNKGDTLEYGTNNIEIKLSKDTVKLNEPFRATAFLRARFFKDKNSYISVYLSHGASQFNKDFSNQNIIKKDTFYNLSIDTVNQKWYRDIDYNRLVVFGKWFDTIGSKSVRGYVSEFYERDITKKDSSVMKEVRTYFDIPVYVTDSIR